MLRPRREEDLERCVSLLREVYEADRYPAIWPPDTIGWLAGRDALAAWVAEEDGRLLGHLSLPTLPGPARSGARRSGSASSDSP